MYGKKNKIKNKKKLKRFWVGFEHLHLVCAILVYHIKSYFIYYTIPFYNTPNILTFILQYNKFK